MNVKTIKTISFALIVMSFLALIGVVGTVSSASAAGGSILINGGALGTKYTQVTLTLVAPDATPGMQMRFRNGTDTWSAFEPFSATKKWSLTSGEGFKTVSVQFTNDNLSILTSSITLSYMLDSSFSAAAIGNPGLTGSHGKAVAVQADGKVVTVGTYDEGNGNSQLQVIRYTANAIVDMQVKYSGSTPGSYRGNAVAVRPDGKIVAVGTFDKGAGNADVWVVQLLPDGTLDTNFADGGYLIIGGGGTSKGNAVALQPDGKIVIVGTYDNVSLNDGTSSVWVIRLLANGALDHNFNFGATDGTNDLSGSVRFGLGGSHIGNGVALQGTSIYVTGTFDNAAYGAPGSTSVWVLKLLNTGDASNTDGQLDTTYGYVGYDPDLDAFLPPTGENTFGYPGNNIGKSIAVLADGSVLAVGAFDRNAEVPPVNDTDIWLLKILPDGTDLDPGFNGGAGSVAFGGAFDDIGNAVAVDANNKIIVVGTKGGSSSTSTIIAKRFDASGIEDPTFNENGAIKSEYEFGPVGTFEGNAVAIQSDGKIVIAGMGFSIDTSSVPSVSTSSIFTMRLEPNALKNLLNVTVIGPGTVSAYPDPTGSVSTVWPKEYYVNTSMLITLTAVPQAGESFVGWSGSTVCTPSPTDPLTCTLTITPNPPELFVTATFGKKYTLNASVIGVGTITSVPGGIACNSLNGSGCSNSFLSGTSVILNATTPTWYTLSGFWSGSTCRGSVTQACTVTMNNNLTAIATYVPNLTSRVVGFGEYAKLSEAYQVAYETGSPATIQTKAFFNQEALLFDSAVDVIFQGGKGSDFSAAAVGYTQVGPLTIRDGSLKASYLKVRSLP